MLSGVSIRQSEVHSLLEQVRAVEDKTAVIALAGSLPHDDDVVAAVVLAYLENSDEPDRPVVIPDLIWAGALLDHLETQGFVVRRKKLKKYG